MKPGYFECQACGASSPASSSIDDRCFFCGAQRNAVVQHAEREEAEAAAKSTEQVGASFLFQQRQSARKV